MELQEYQTKAIRTMKELGSEAANCNHMIIGMNSEFNEMMTAFLLKDGVNKKEEVGDFLWYFVNYATLRRIPLILNYIPRPLPQEDLDVISKIKWLDGLIYLTSKLTDTIKKFIVYNNPEKVHQEFEIMYVENIYWHLQNHPAWNFTLEDCYYSNIQKLQEGANARYKNAVYTDEAALNRNLEGERKELEK